MDEPSVNFPVVIVFTFTHTKKSNINLRWSILPFFFFKISIFFINFFFFIIQQYQLLPLIGHVWTPTPLFCIYFQTFTHTNKGNINLRPSVLPFSLIFSFNFSIPH